MVPLLKLIVMCIFLGRGMAEDPQQCRGTEFRDMSGSCVTCRQCEAGFELSMECGFGYGEDAKCMACRPSRFKEDRGSHKCKPCLECTHISRFQKANCSATSNTECGDCLPGFYKKTKFSGFQDMNCIPCGNPPPPYEIHCSSRVNLVPAPSPVSSPRDMALATLICSALVSVMLALIALCVIYCKRQLLERKPSGLVSLSPSPFCDEAFTLDLRNDTCHSQSIQRGASSSPFEGNIPLMLGVFSEPSCGVSTLSLNWARRDPEAGLELWLIGSIRPPEEPRANDPIPEPGADQATEHQSVQGSGSIPEILHSPKLQQVSFQGE